MRFRKLRIAWSVGCGVLCLLLIVLWVRSYWRLDVWVRNNNLTSTIVRADTGLITFSQSKFQIKPSAMTLGYMSLKMRHGEWFTGSSIGYGDRTLSS